MTTNQDNRYHEEVALLEVLSAESTHQIDDMWEGNFDEDYDDEEEGFDVGPGGNRKRLVDWASDALRSVKPTWQVSGKMLPSLKSWALAAKGAVVQCWGGWTGQEEAIVETAEVPHKSELLCLKKPTEMSLHEKRLLKAKLVKHITDGERNLVTSRD
jgi:hypothetical protein